VTDLLTEAEQLKFLLLETGVGISDVAQAYIDERNDGRQMTPADYASTSGVILELEDQVWVNAPIAQFNSNFVTAPPFVLDLDGSALVVRGRGLESAARFWLPPAYHGTLNEMGEPLNSYAFTHSDRVRISPIEGCSMVCKFCNLPYEFRYRTKRVEGLVDSVRTALEDPIQPAHHVLISGGTPHSKDVGYTRDVYESVIKGFPGLPVDIMMVPRDDLLDPHWVQEIGVNELSVNIEIFNEEIAAKTMRSKAAQGLDTYLDYLQRASEVLGAHRVRSMLMVGLEPMEDTLAGVRAIAERGAVPVLSPFRPDAATPMRDVLPPGAEQMQETYLRAREITTELGVPLGPGCIPCSHNTLTLAETGDAGVYHAHPRRI